MTKFILFVLCLILIGGLATLKTDEYIEILTGCESRIRSMFGITIDIISVRNIQREESTLIKPLCNPEPEDKILTLSCTMFSCTYYHQKPHLQHNVE